MKALSLKNWRKAPNVTRFAIKRNELMTSWHVFSVWTALQKYIALQKCVYMYMHIYTHLCNTIILYTHKHYNAIYRCVCARIVSLAGIIAMPAWVLKWWMLGWLLQQFSLLRRPLRAGLYVRKEVEADDGTGRSLNSGWRLSNSCNVYDESHSSLCL